MCIHLFFMEECITMKCFLLKHCNVICLCKDLLIGYFFAGAWHNSSRGCMVPLCSGATLGCTSMYMSTGCKVIRRTKVEFTKFKYSVCDIWPVNLHDKEFMMLVSIQHLNNIQTMEFFFSISLLFSVEWICRAILNRDTVRQKMATPVSHHARNYVHVEFTKQDQSFGCHIFWIWVNFIFCFVSDENHCLKTINHLPINFNNFW
jgi:hypothetical protein